MIRHLWHWLLCWFAKPPGKWHVTEDMDDLDLYSREPF
jgi:hypothetical protein